MTDSSQKRRIIHLACGFVSGAAIGILGGLIGLGGAEFRLPLLISLFHFPALEAVILNKALSLVVVSSALPFRTGTVPVNALIAAWPIVVNLLAGSLLGAWLGAGLATRLRSKSLRQVIAVLLLVMAIILMLSSATHTVSIRIGGFSQVVAGVVAGLIIGCVASLLGVAGGELLIPTLVTLFGVDMMLAGSLSLVVSLPTMAVGFMRYSRDASFRVLHDHWEFVVAMGLGSLVGTFMGAQLLSLVPHMVLVPLLAIILVLSAFKLWSHRAK